MTWLGTGYIPYLLSWKVSILFIFVSCLNVFSFLSICSRISLRYNPESVKNTVACYNLEASNLSISGYSVKQILLKYYKKKERIKLMGSVQKMKGLALAYISTNLEKYVSKEGSTKQSGLQ